MAEAGERGRSLPLARRMTNVIAADCGLQGSPIDALDRFLFRRARGEVKRVRRPLMGVTIGDREPVYGFFLGAGAYGVAAAAERYFQKELSELTLAESALIAGLVTQPLILKNTKSAMGEGHLIFIATGGPAFASDLDRGRRAGNHADMCDFIRLVQSLNVIHQDGGTGIEPTDLP
ncbi:MAG: hypothetical protein HC777_02955, partial [Hyphomonadaceae bacterium]|nr:hypothetical protein [Hyphomonadaceae bacterium]